MPKEKVHYCKNHNFNHNFLCKQLQNIVLIRLYTIKYSILLVIMVKRCTASTTIKMVCKYFLLIFTLLVLFDK